MNHRSTELELLDLGQFDKPEYEQCLRQLRTINILTDGYSPTLKAIRSLLANRTNAGPVRILDIGSGFGDMLRKIAEEFRGQRWQLDLVGLDIEPWAVEIAERETPADLSIRFEKKNILDIDGTEKFDIIINSLFMHHLKEHEAVTVLRWMTRHSSLGWFINDLQRHPVAYYFIKYFSALAGFNRLIRHDGPLSVARAFKLQDWERFLELAGIPRDKVVIKRHWSFRYGLLFLH